VVGHTRETIAGLVGQEIGVSDWVTVTQEMVDRFADLTNDHQFIHVDVEAARASPLGGTVAHGFLTLALLGGLASSADFLMDGLQMAFNYGFEKVRFLAPVRTGARVRARFVLKSNEERAPGQWLSTTQATMEIEGEDRPALVADWLNLQIT